MYFSKARDQVQNFSKPHGLSVYFTLLLTNEYFLVGPDVGSTMDAGDAITLLQSLVGSTFDSSNLIVTACISFSYVTEDTLQTLRQKHRPDVIAAVQERTKGENLRKSSKGLATKLYSFKKEREPIVRELSIKQGLNEKGVDKDSLDLMSPLKRDMSFNMEPIATEMDSLSDLQDQVRDLFIKNMLILVIIFWFPPFSPY
ncbi:hypothetical protein HanOQP8_Chr01g0033391 [Helianthus annuus]|nr:hypothetical protein HanOQP8_Chr01g0033391 [Helianthus annuus]